MQCKNLLVENFRLSRSSSPFVASFGHPVLLLTIIPSFPCPTSIQEKGEGVALALSWDEGIVSMGEGNVILVADGEIDLVRYTPLL